MGYCGRRLARNYWGWVSPVYCGAAFAVLWYLCPYQEDGSGPMATFFCANCPTPTGSEFRDHYWELIWPFAIPYFVAACLLTVLGCGLAPRLARSWWRVGLVSWGLIVLLAVVVDLGSWARLWQAGSKIFNWDLWVIGQELKMSGLIAGFTAVFTCVERRLPVRKSE